MNTSCYPSPEKAVTAPPTERTESAPRAVRRPRYRIDSTPEHHTVQVDLPGVTKESVQLAVEEGLLTLKAARHTATPESWKALHRELSDADYELRLKLNDRVDDQALTANLDDGVLTIVLPVKEAVRPRAIPIQ
jgi:HSP20 family protein